MIFFVDDFDVNNSGVGVGFKGVLVRVGVRGSDGVRGSLDVRGSFDVSARGSFDFGVKNCIGIRSRVGLGVLVAHG
ncbi:hypothetical protein AYI69_g7060 [Smittium culicis]|uniref:Uncharacterized protein n=1 Tax=Smittium culicis TaxID=133412 RepID=A0A1R1XUP6_9FUNG|nr:hypothetical protein AYI69_g7060 [Smittium culicis]